MNQRDSLKRLGLEPWEIRHVVRSRRERLERERLNRFAEARKAMTDLRPRLVRGSGQQAVSPEASDHARLMRQSSDVGNLVNNGTRV